MLKMETFAGSHIDDVIAHAIQLARDNKELVKFEFNGVEVRVCPSDTVVPIREKWSCDLQIAHEAHINSPEYKQRVAEREAEFRRKQAAHLVEATNTEAEMREAESPWPYTLAQLTEYVQSLVDKAHDYGTCVYAMSLAATAAFNFVAHQLGTTGFQSSCADLDFLRRSRHLDGPFMLIKAADALYPQYDLREQLEKALEEWQPWLREQAQKNLTERGQARPDVVRHWKKLAVESQ